MQTYETEEQQVEALKQWWKDNGRSVIGGLVIGIAAIVGWKGWVGHKQQHAENASQLYDQLSGYLRIEDDAGKSRERVEALGSELLNDYDDTPYAAMADLALARLAVDQGDNKDARLRLLRVASGDSGLEMNAIARLRLARLYVSEGDSDAALQELDKGLPESFQAMADEIRGDAWLAMGDKAAAAKAWDQALAAMGKDGPQRNLLQMKRNDLGA